MNNEEKDLKQEAPQPKASLAQQSKPEEMKLDDARRVKVLSPGMLVFKRFIRNKLAVVGIIILVVMFLFSFVGPIFSPYSIAQIFTKDVEEPGKYATGKFNTDPRFVGEASSSMQSAVLKTLGTTKVGGKDPGYALKAGQEISFDVKGEPYTLRVINPDKNTPTVGIFGTKLIATIKLEGEMLADTSVVDEGFEAALKAHFESNSKETKFDYNGTTVYAEISKIERKYYIASDEPVAIASFNIYTATLGKVADLQADTAFLHAVSVALMDGETSVSHNDNNYTITGDPENGYLLSGSDGSGLFNITRENQYHRVSVEKVDAEGNTVNEQVDFVSTIEDVSAFEDAVNEAIDTEASSFSFGDEEYSLQKKGKIDYVITNSANEPVLTVANSFTREKQYHRVSVEKVDAEGNTVDEQVDFVSTIEDVSAFEDAVNEAIDTEASSFSFGDEEYSLQKKGKIDYVITNSANEPVLTVANSFTPVATKYDTLGTELGYCFAMESAIAQKKDSFEYQGETYTVVNNGADYSIFNARDEEILLVSDIAYGADYVGIELTIDFVKNLQEAMRSGSETFSFVNQYGEETNGMITVVNGNYYVSTMQKTSLIDTRAGLSSDHPLGTDVNGMDVLTRLMYGGRVSLIVGFVVVFFEIFLGVLVGGVSGFFGGVVDTILMRFVELFNAIPFYPMLIILGSVMDAQHVDPTSRLMMTMAILGILGWTGIARLVRGQILSLREQDFMVAAEATGIRTSRRIFKHLIPNVMPLLIVNATASLGGIILTEATLGYLGLGVKYPMASWGSIINQVNDMQVMKAAWWIWIPAGLFIMTTVLGFNFVGDGLRDAFDPKMKR